MAALGRDCGELYASTGKLTFARLDHRFLLQREGMFACEDLFFPCFHFGLLRRGHGGHDAVDGCGDLPSATTYTLSP